MVMAGVDFAAAFFLTGTAFFFSAAAGRYIGMQIGPGGEISNVNALENLKSAIDQMRHFLWFYFQVLNNESDVRERMRQALPSSKENNSDPNDELNFLTQKAFLRYRLNGKKPN